MGKFILGVIVTVLVLVLGGLGLAMLGFIPVSYTHLDVYKRQLSHR